MYCGSGGDSNPHTFNEKNIWPIGDFKIKTPFPMRGHHIGSTSHDIQGLDILDKHSIMTRFIVTKNLNYFIANFFDFFHQ